MKKIFLNLMAICFALFAMVSLIACSSDDDAPSSASIKENIVGLWQTTHISGWTYDGTEEENLMKIDQDITDDSRYAQRFLFKGDGTFYSYFYSTYSDRWIAWSNYETYDISGNKLLIYYKNELEDTYEVISLKGNTAVIQYHMDEGHQYKTKLTCKRIL